MDHWQNTAFHPDPFTGSVSPSFGLPFVGPGTAVDLGLATAKSAGLDNLFEDSFSGTTATSNSNWPLLRSEKLKLDRSMSMIEPSLVRGLIDGYYFPILHSLYPVVDRSQVEFHVPQIKHLPLKKQLFVGLTAAIAAAHQGRGDPSMGATALSLRTWADDLIPSVLAQQDDDSLQTMILLIFYELIDPRRKLIWYLLGLTCRMCVRLRWHREDESVVSSTAEQDLANHLARYPSPWRRRLFRIVYEWERLVCVALQRPSIFSHDLVDMSFVSEVSGCTSTSSNTSILRTLHTELALRQKIRDCSTDACMLDCQFVSFVHENVPPPSPPGSEGGSVTSDILWLTIYLTTQYTWVHSSIHEQYKIQWTDKILRAAMSRISALFAAQRGGRIVSIWLSTIEVFTVGTTILDILLRQRQRRRDAAATATATAKFTDASLDRQWSQSLRRASSLLAGFSELWEGARVYRDVFDAVSDRVFAELEA
ncbi:hypothetical protein A1O3_05985 [Capronia epimyces CBS 606.96]|uniref:Xylanolytic transcriptional activator regulatory domain-containing protein n=1 Tax=Capronia epimyces CBS 606.96 TaxID=1182542 RepID=W9Y6P9_9EURO|nr:uncharacterized protein A1O3_05985 [Capronia epimyces CBS 606.96]EXJ85310.1 hypothetical protein A1O3_05985 [Capronia epimyces CBS 606.96]